MVLDDKKISYIIKYLNLGFNLESNKTFKQVQETIFYNFDKEEISIFNKEIPDDCIHFNIKEVKQILSDEFNFKTDEDINLQEFIISVGLLFKRYIDSFYA